MIIIKKRRFFKSFEGKRCSITLPHVLILEHPYEMKKLSTMHLAEFVFEKTANGELKVIKDRTGKLLKGKHDNN